MADKAISNFVKTAQDFFPGKPAKINKINISYKHKINKKFVDDMCRFVKFSADKASKIDLHKVVVGFSGGIDSVATALLCKRAVGKERVTVVIVNLGPKIHKDLAKFSAALAKKLDLNFEVIEAQNLLNNYYELMDSRGPFTEINIRTRIIQNAIFQYADSNMALVASTIDKSEALTGRHMEYFYGHFAPLVSLYKSEVFDLVRFFKVPAKVFADEPGCVGGWLDKNLFGAPYEILDPILYLMSEKKLSTKKIAQKYNIDRAWLTKLEYRFKYQKLRMQTRLLKL